MGFDPSISDIYFPDESIYVPSFSSDVEPGLTQSDIDSSLAIGTSGEAIIAQAAANQGFSGTISPTSGIDWSIPSMSDSDIIAALQGKDAGPDLIGASATDILNLAAVGAVPVSAGALKATTPVTQTNPAVNSTGSSAILQNLGMLSAGANAASQVIAAANGTPTTASRILGALGTTGSLISRGATVSAAPTTSWSSVLLWLAAGVLVLALVLKMFGKGK